jgi:hypothetical protein
MQAPVKNNEEHKHIASQKLSTQADHKELKTQKQSSNQKSSERMGFLKEAITTLKVR